MVEDGNRAFAHHVALFMKSQFQYRLAQVTALPCCPPKPVVPNTIRNELLEGCFLAVEQCIAAFTNPCKHPLAHVLLNNQIIGKCISIGTTMNIATIALHANCLAAATQSRREIWLNDGSPPTGVR